MSRNSNLDTWFWVGLLVVILVARLYPNFTPQLTDDSFQYLSAGQNMLAGRAGYTSLIHYDVERSFSVAPAPLVTFPLGYPSAIALVGATGVSSVSGALLLSALSVIGCVALLARIGRQLGLSSAIRNAMLAVFVLNGAVSEFGSAVLSEAPFMFLVLAGVAQLSAARARDERSGTLLWIGAGLAFGAAYFARYAGLFFIVGLVLLALRHAVSREWPLARGHAIALVTAGLFVAAGVARNALMVGNWHGRDDLSVNNPLLPALAQTGQAMNALFFGIGTGSIGPFGTFVPKLLLCMLLALGIAALVRLRWRQGSLARASSGAAGLGGDIGTDLLVLSLGYAACMLYAALTSEISYGTARNFIPLLPLLLLLLGRALDTLFAPLDRDAKRLPAVALLICLGLYAYLNVLVIRKPLTDQSAGPAARLDAVGDDGRSARAAILARVKPQDVILANNGQAVGFVLDRPTISMVGPAFSRVAWNEETVRSMVARYHAAALVISAPDDGRADDADVIPSPFVRDLIQGHSPGWLRLEHRTKSVLVYVPVLAGR